MTIFTPVNQVRLTNVAVIRLKKGGKRFEIACYKNKLLDWKNKSTTNLSDILQTDKIFLNVSKGQLASKEELAAAFGQAATSQQIVEEIMRRGEMQVSEKERSVQSAASVKDIATIIAEKCLNSTTKKPYSANIIEKAMSEVHYTVSLSKSAKQQALEVIKQLQLKKTIPIIRCLMKLSIHLPPPTRDLNAFGASLEEVAESIEGKAITEEGEYTAFCLILPGSYRKVVELVEESSKGRGSVQVVSINEVSAADDS